MDLDQAADTALAVLDESRRTRFAVDPLSVIRDDLGLKVQAVGHLTERRDDGGACDGVSFLQDGVILYAPTDSSKRENFTLAHELGHWLVEQRDELYDWLADQDEPQHMLETLCDGIAQRLLLPQGLIDSVVGSGAIRATQVLELYNLSEASRPVCAIALAKRLPCCGAVLLVDRESEQVTYASIKPDAEEGWPTVFPWPGQRVPGGHPFLSMRPGGEMHERRPSARLL